MDKLELNKDDLVTWFSTPEKFLNIKTINNWLQGRNKPNLKKLVDAKIFIDNFFTISDFEDKIALSDFEEKLVTYKERNLFPYRYIHNLSSTTNDHHYWKLETINARIEGTKIIYDVKAIPESNDTNKSYLLYNGTLEDNATEYFLHIQHEREHLTCYFKKSVAYPMEQSILGLCLGLSYEDHKTPRVSNKLLSFNKELTELDKQKLYLSNLNGQFISQDIRQSGQSSQIYRKNFAIKMENLADSILLYEENNKIHADIYTNIFIKSLKALGKASTKVLKYDKYFTTSRRRATNIFLETSFKLKEKCYIVYPVFTEYSTLFTEHNTSAEKSLRLNCKLAKEGLEMIRILVIDSNYKPTEYFKESVQSLIDVGVDIRIVYKEELDVGVTSYDFVLNDKNKVALQRTPLDKICYFEVTRNIEEINKLKDTWKRIEQKSIEWDEYLKSKSIVLHTQIME